MGLPQGPLRRDGSELDLRHNWRALALRRDSPALALRHDGPELDLCRDRLTMLSFYCVQQLEI